jgi:hypothetical protein
VRLFVRFEPAASARPRVDVDPGKALASLSTRFDCLAPICQFTSGFS